MDTSAFKWSFFIAHAGADIEVAQALYERLSKHAPTFLDKRASGLLGADWDLELARAQRESLISVVLVSRNTERAYYEREEIAAALALAREEHSARRVVPLYLDREAAAPGTVPYGLALKGGLTLDGDFDIDDAAQALLALLQQVRQAPDAPAVALPAPRAAGARTRRRLAAVAVAFAAALGLAIGAWRAWGPPADEGGGARDAGAAASAPGGGGAGETAAASAAGDARRRCLEVSHLSPSVIPHYLLNSIGTRNFPYWLKIVAHNRCDGERSLTLSFVRSDKVALSNPPQIFTFTVHRNSTLEQIFEPTFDFPAEPPEKLVIHWQVQDQRGTVVDSDGIGIELTPPQTLAWDLRKPVAPGRHEAVEPEYLLASLKAWTLKPAPALATRGRACRQPAGGGLLLEREAAIEACYRNLFGAGGGSGAGSAGNIGRVQVSDGAIPFPDAPRQYLRKPMQLLADPGKRASALEAALLLATVLDVEHQPSIDPDLVLLIAPRDAAGPRESKTAYLAWREAGQPWRAVDLRLAGSRSFAANAAEASAAVQGWLSGAEFAARLARHGVAWGHDGDVAALDLGKVPGEYRINALP